MFKRINLFIDALLYSNIFISVAAVCFTIQTELIFSLYSGLKSYHFFIFFSTLFEYCLSRYISIKSVRQSFELREAESWVLSRMNLQYVLLSLSFAGILILAFYLSIPVIVVFIISGAVTILYTLPLLSVDKKLFRLRDLPLIKIFLVSIVWTVVTIFPPLFESDNLNCSDTELVLFFLQRMCFVFAITVPFDMRDSARDEKAGIVTLPLCYGQKNAELFSYCAIIIFILTQLILVALHKQMRMVDIAMVVSGVITFVFLYSKKTKTARHYHYGVLDGMLMLQFLLVWLAVKYF